MPLPRDRLSRTGTGIGTRLRCCGEPHDEPHSSPDLRVAFRVDSPVLPGFHLHQGYDYQEVGETEGRDCNIGPGYGSPSVNEVKELGPDIRAFLIHAGSYVSTFIALGQRTCSQTLHIYLSNTYSRAVLAGMAALL